MGCVLFLLFVLSFVQPDVQDTSLECGLRSLDTLMRRQYPNVTAGTPVSWLMREYARVWASGNKELGVDPRLLLYLDLQQMTYCNEFAIGGQSCSLYDSTALIWSNRTSLNKIDEDLISSPYR